jgi:hypothetical protein
VTCGIPEKVDRPRGHRVIEFTPAFGRPTPHVAIQRPISNRLGDVLPLDVVVAFQIGECAIKFKWTVVCARLG